MTSERDAHPDEGTIHAWLDRQLDATSASTLEAHLQRCDECAERVAEARGLIAGSSRILTSLDDPAPAAQRPEPMRPVMQRRSGTVRRRSFRLTPTRSAIAAVLVVAVGLAILHEHDRPTSRLASVTSESAAGTGAASPITPAPPAIGGPVTGAPMAAPPVAAPSVAAAPKSAAPATTGLDSTAGTRVAAARSFSRAQRETTVNADLARVGQAPPGGTSPAVEQTIAAARVADSVAGGSRKAAGTPPVAMAGGAAGGVAGGIAGGVARAAAPIAAPVAGAEPPQCYRVESATGAAAAWGPVPLPFVLWLDAPATRATARVLTTEGKDTDVRAVFERRDGDSLAFTLRRIGYTGTLAVGAPGDVRAGVMRSSPATLALNEVVTTAAPAEQRRALRKPSAAAARADSAATAASRGPRRDATPAVPVVVRKVECR